MEPVGIRPDNARTRLLTAAPPIIRENGYGATSVEEPCGAVGATKGAFFHHFQNREELADRVFASLDFREALISGGTAEFTCLVGMAQKAFQTSPAIRDACFASIAGHAETLEADLAEAIEARGIEASAGSLALHTQAMPRGGFILDSREGEGRSGGRP